MNLLVTAKELRTVAKWCLKTADRIEKLFIEDESMSLATKVIAALQAENQTLTTSNADKDTQIANLNQQLASAGTASQQLATLQAEGAIESPDDLTTIQNAATALGVTPDPTAGNGNTNQAGGTVAPQVQPQTAVPAATTPLVDANGKTVYAYTGTTPETIDPVTWPSAGAFEGKPIYYFKGDVNPGDENGAKMVGFALIMVPKVA